MSNDDPNVRRLLPQNPQMGGFSGFAPQTYQQPPRETQKNYVFVDEHNRHKRLKVMRACEGCRRRKIKCDAATTNTWPCSACIRLKTHCVRPNGYDGSSTDAQGYDLQSDYASSQLSDDGFRPQMSMQPAPIVAGSQKSAAPMYVSQSSYADAAGIYQPVPYSTSPSGTQNLNYTTVPPGLEAVNQSYAAQNVFPTPPPMQQSSRGDSPRDIYHQDQYGQQDLADLLGTLKMDEAGSAPYLNRKTRAGQEEGPALEDSDEYKSALPPLQGRPGSKVRIPPELMPDEETILQYFDLYFTNVHPYVPVLDKSAFYHQWRNNRESLSPLLLEAIFAIAGRLVDDPAQGQQWLALATKHADSFMDVPRLSTLQALLITLKAREAAPKRGYYYRSWMAIVQCVEMGKDLGLDDHYADHQAGRSCHLSPAECLMKTRIWQTIFVCEVMIGGPQGRTDLNVDFDTVDLSVPRPSPDVDQDEYDVSRNFTYFARVVSNVFKINQIYGRIKKKKDWGLDPDLVRMNPIILNWLNELPADMAISFPPDDSPPWLTSAFLGNLHSYYYLSVVMLHRAQLNFSEPTSPDGQWKNHMMICYSSAKYLCRVQEAIYNTYGLNGLLCMQRGISYTIYCILTCIVLHLVALTSPDPDFSTDAREYFTRHMRLLETCMTAWPMPDMQRQIDAVCEAFSADTRKPFVLKPSFPYGSPHPTNHSSPLRANTSFESALARSRSMEQVGHTSIPPHSQVSYTSHPISPPISATPVDSRSDSSPAMQSLGMMAAGQVSQPPLQQTLPLTDTPGWNPSRIFDQWNTTFGAAEIPTVQDIQTVHASLPHVPQSMSQPQFSAAPVPTFVTPAMWQESVASVYEGGLKRSWDYDGNTMPMAKRR